MGALGVLRVIKPQKKLVASIRCTVTITIICRREIDTHLMLF